MVQGIVIYQPHGWTNSSPYVCSSLIILLIYPCVVDDRGTGPTTGKDILVHYFHP